MLNAICLTFDPSFSPFPRQETRNYYNETAADAEEDIYASLKDIGMYVCCKGSVSTWEGVPDNKLAQVIVLTTSSSKMTNVHFTMLIQTTERK